MKLIIDIDENLLEGIKSDDFDFARRVVKNFQATIASEIANGTPIPKGHGRLIDADAYAKYDAHINGRIGDEYIIAPTIIEADKEG